MKIAMFTDHFYPELGGIQDSVMLTAATLGARGHSVEIFAPRHPRAHHAAGEDPATSPDLGLNVAVHRRVSFPFASSTGQSRAAVPLPSSLAALSGRRRPDVIHSHSFFGLGLEALACGRALGVPVIGTNHTYVPGFAGLLPIPVRWAARWMSAYYRHCDIVTAPSRAALDGLGNVIGAAAHIVSNPIDVRTFRRADADLRHRARAQFGLSGHVLVHAGRLAPEKNVESILRALALLPPDVSLALAGQGTHETALRSLAASTGIAARVHFLGRLDQGRLASLLAAGDLFVTVSTSETQSMVSLQAMACGLPVIAADSAGLAETVDATRGRLVAPHDPAAIAAAIADLLDHPAQREALAAAACRHAQRFSAESVCDVWEGLYESVQSRSAPAWSLS